MSETAQNFANHTRIVKPFHLGVFPVLVLNFIWSAVLFITGLTAGVWSILAGLVGLLLAVVLIGMFFFTRIFALTVQDRLIRLEMHLRLREVLPEDLKPHIGELTVGQLIALRFASDAEMPELMRTVLSEKIVSRSEIKKRIKDWQGDYLRV